MAKSRWISLVQITLWCSVAIHHPTIHVEAISNSLQGQIQHQHYQKPSTSLQISPKELRRLRAKGLEIMPTGNSISSGTISEEPSCDELRAMWRYYRRNARNAELTNQIPQFQLQDVFWGLGGGNNAGEPQSFGPLKGKSRPNFRPKGPRNPLYGKILRKQNEKSPELSQRRRPMDEVIELINPSSSLAIQNPQTSDKSEPTLLLTPPLQPTPKSGLDKIKEMLRDERVLEGGVRDGLGERSSQGHEYGKVVLSPPSGTDGRVANKPRELMTPFERIRFGHTDDLFNVNEEGPRRRQGSHLFPIMKRRNGFLALPMLNRQRSSWRPFAMSPRQSSGSSLRPSKFEDSIIILQNSRGVNPKSNDLTGSGQGERSSPGERSFPGETPFPNGESSFIRNPKILGSLEDEIGGRDLNEYEVENGPMDVLLAKEPLIVDESIPLCSEVKDESCSANSDCSCLGHGLYRCYAGQCQTLSLKGAFEEAGESSSEFWHTEPLNSYELGAWAEGNSSPPGAGLDSKRKRSADAAEKA